MLHRPEACATDLGRVKSPANRDRLAKVLAKMPLLDWPPFAVKELTLFQSVLSPRDRNIRR